MLERFGKTLLTLIAVMLVADPVMACCFATSADASNTVTQEIKPPCHGAQATSTDNVAPEPANNSCPGCGDCSSSMMASDHTELLALSTNASNGVDEAAISKHSIPPKAFRIAKHNLIPNEHSLHPTDTPISLKQRLLI